MGDQAEYGAAMRAERQERHARWKAENLATLRASGVPFEERAETCLFREPGRPRVDFYPSTGRWRVVGGGREATRSGGARRFLAWYAKQAVPNRPTEALPKDQDPATGAALGEQPDQHSSSGKAPGNPGGTRVTLSALHNEPLGERSQASPAASSVDRRPREVITDADHGPNKVPDDGLQPPSPACALAGDRVAWLETLPEVSCSRPGGER